MTIKSSGSLSFSEISSEFGLPPGKNLGAYRVSQNVGTLTNLPLDNGIPQSGTIKFSDFYDKKLNMVVDLYSIPDYSTRINAKRDRYDLNFVIVIGGFRSKPESTSGTKIYINVNKIIGSRKGNRNYVALRTGNWDSDTELVTVIGPNGALYGAGGDGGSGGSIDGLPNPSFNGGQGTSALGIEYPTTLVNQGIISAGTGGGGGGAAGWGWVHTDVQDGCDGRRNERLKVGGAGGAGGKGFPSGDGGLANTGLLLSGRQGIVATNGTAGTVTENGEPGYNGFVYGRGPNSAADIVIEIPFIFGPSGIPVTCGGLQVRAGSVGGQLVTLNGRGGTPLLAEGREVFVANAGLVFGGGDGGDPVTTSTGQQVFVGGTGGQLVVTSAPFGLQVTTSSGPLRRGGCDGYPVSGGGKLTKPDGGGGAAETAGMSGWNAEGFNRYSNYGQGGQRGYAVIISSSGSLISLSGNSPASGSIVNQTVS